MTKAELIERYGQEWYEEHKAKKREHYHNDAKFREEHKAKCNARHKDRYNNDAEFRETYKVKWRKRYIECYQKYCRPGEFELIENYELAKADNFKGWDIHHRLELTLDGEYAHSIEELKRMNMYYNRPYFELIFLTRKEHNKLHKCTKVDKQ